LDTNLPVQYSYTIGTAIALLVAIALVALWRRKKK
jgi:LPXTG-motif cell wall-anchored protein